MGGSSSLGTEPQGLAFAAARGYGAPTTTGEAEARRRLTARFGASIERAPGVVIMTFEHAAIYREVEGSTWRPVPSDAEGAPYRPLPYTGDEVARLAELTGQGQKTWAHKKDLSRAEIDALVGKMRSHCGPVIVDPETGLPMNPGGKTGVSGRGESNYGPILAQDMLMTTVDPASGKRFAVLIQRKDTGRWAMPGGIEDAKDQGAKVPTAVREFFEEALPEEQHEAFLGQVADAFKGARQVFQGLCAKEPRNTDNMWFETTVFRVDVPWELAKALPLTGSDDAKAAQLVELTPGVIAALHGDHPDFVALALTG